MARPRSVPAVLLALASLAGCAESQCKCADTGADGAADLLAALAVGDEVVATVTPADVGGDWSDEDDPGAVVELRLGRNLPRHVVLPGGVGVPQDVALGAWDGGAFAWDMVAGDADVDVSLRADPAAATVPVLGLRDDRWFDDAPLLVYVEDGAWTWVFTNEDGGYGLLPPLLLARFGRPVDIEALYDEAGPTLQTTDHAWVPFDGPWEGDHPLLQVITDNGMLGPYDDAGWHVAPMPVAFSPDADGVPREVVLDSNGWLLATSFAEEVREGWAVEDGGPEDGRLGGPRDYVYVDYVVTGDARFAFEARVGDAWVSSTNGLSTSEGLTDARLSGGTGRTAVELPAGADVADVAGIGVYSYEGGGEVVSARWFGLDAAPSPVELGTAVGVAFAAGALTSLEE